MDLSQRSKLGCKFLHRVQRLRQVRQGERLPATKRKGLSSPTRVLDLPSIHRTAREPRDDRLCFCFCNPRLAEERAPDLRAGGRGELAEVEGDVDALFFSSWMCHLIIMTTLL